MKEIVKGESYVMLSQEEVEALRKAVNFGLDNLEEEQTVCSIAFCGTIERKQLKSKTV